MKDHSAEPELDLAKEQRTDRIKWAIVVGTVLLGLARFFFHFPVFFFQAFVATILCYGNEFYRERGGDFSKSWLWKAGLATLPLHLVYLVGLYWCDLFFPETMTKVIVFMPVIFVGFGLEALLFDRIIKNFVPR